MKPDGKTVVHLGNGRTTTLDELRKEAPDWSADDLIRDHHAKMQKALKALNAKL